MQSKAKQPSQNEAPTPTPKTTAVAAPAPTAVGDPISFHEDAGKGMEGATADSFAIPFLVVLQNMSPQVDEASGEAVEGARAGMFYESVGRTLFSGKEEGVLLVPCAYRRVFIHWGPRSGAGAGFKGELTPEFVASEREARRIVDMENRLYYPEKDGSINPKTSDRVVDTRNHYCLLRNGEGWQQVLVSLASTQIKKSKNLMAALANIRLQGPSGSYTPPTFGSVVRATTVPESNDQGNWFGWRFVIEDRVRDAELYAAARAFRDSVVKGLVEARYEEPADSTGADGGGNGF